MKKFWVSWWTKQGGFELHSPWWFTGVRDDARSVCAAVLAENEEAAKEKILAAYDIRPDTLEFRFVEERPDDWNPFNSRFQRRDWMQWET